MTLWTLFLFSLAGGVALLAAYAWQYFKCDAFVAARRIEAPRPDTFFRTTEGYRFLKFVLERGYAECPDGEVRQAFERLRRLQIAVLLFVALYGIGFAVAALAGA